MSPYAHAGYGNVMPLQNGYGYSHGPFAHYQPVGSTYHGAYATHPAHATPHSVRTMSTGHVVPPDVSNMRDPRPSFSQVERIGVAKPDELPAYHAQPAPYETAPPPPPPPPPPAPASVPQLAQAPPASPAPAGTASSPQSIAPEPTFSTDVDRLVRQIQSKAGTATSDDSPITANAGPSPEVAVSVYAAPTVEVVDPAAAGRARRDQGEVASPKNKKRYECDVPGCGKAFSQKTHLEIHMRAHTGYKPFVSLSSRSPAST